MRKNFPMQSLNKKVYPNLVDTMIRRAVIPYHNVIKRGNNKLQSFSPEYGVQETKLNVRNIVGGVGPTLAA